MTKMNRRTFFTGAAACGAALATPTLCLAAPRVGPDRLWIRRAITGETLNDSFVFRSEIAQRASWALYSHFWRDIKDGGAMVWIDRSLLLVMADLQVALTNTYGGDRIITVNSGYRTRRRNATLEGAATFSEHIVGRAADFTVQGLSNSQVADMAIRIPGVGGVGRYPGFTHVDVGGSGRRWGHN